MKVEDKTDKQAVNGQGELQMQPVEQRLPEIRNQLNYFRIKGDRRKFNAILNRLPNGISIISEDYRVQFENVWLQDRFGSNVRKLCYKVYRNREAPCANCPIRESIERYNVERSEFKWPDGRYYELTTIGLGKFNGKISVLQSIVDITDRKLAEEKIRSLNRELQKSNKRLAHLALRDSHTGLYNHQYLKKIIEVELSRARRHAYPFSVIMLDIDYFKSINDAYGHQFGDLVLKQLAKQFKRSVRQHDVVIRFGGEEFIIILPRTDKLNGTIFAQKLLKAVKSFRFGTAQNTVKIKLSAGIVSYPESKVVKGIDLVNLADQLLYKVKEDGGGRVYTSIDTNNEKQVFLEDNQNMYNVKSIISKVDHLTKRTYQSLMEEISAFAKISALKDKYNDTDFDEAIYCANKIAKQLRLPQDQIEQVKRAVLLRDLGKIGIDERILKKNSRLTSKEFKEIKMHPQLSTDIMKPIQFLYGIIPLIRYHHERWDGSGYPYGLKGERIPLGARIVELIAVYQALISDRPYRKAYSKDEVINLIKSGSGTQFDPKIVSVFLSILQNEKL